MWAGRWACPTRTRIGWRVSSLSPSTQTLERALGESAQLKQAYDLDPAVRSLVDTAQGLEGIARHASTHAAGVVISRDPLVEHVPLQRPARGDDPDALPTTQYAMEQVAKIGLLKMDFLGAVQPDDPGPRRGVHPPQPRGGDRSASPAGR